MGIQGGEHRDNRFFLNGHRDNELVIPDVVDERSFTEVKGRFHRQEYLLVDRQASKYLEFQRAEPDKDFYFFFFSYGIPAIRSFDGSKEDLWNACAEKTYFAQRIPLRIVLSAHVSAFDSSRDCIYKDRYSSRYEGCQLPSSSRLHPKLFNDLLINPAEVIDELGLDPDSFSYKRYRSPKDFKICGHEFEGYKDSRGKNKRFPILLIEDKLPVSEWMSNYNVQERLGYTALVDGKYVQRKPGEVIPRAELFEGVSDSSEEGLPKELVVPDDIAPF